MLDVSYAQPRESRGVAHKALSVLMALVLTVGLMPVAPAGQAWADSTGTIELAAGTHQSSGKTALTCDPGDKSVTLYAQVQNFTLNGTDVVSGGSKVSNAFSQDDCNNFKVAWYDGSASGTPSETDTLEWNDQTGYPKWATDFDYTPASLRGAENGSYKFYAVASYDGITSDPLEFTVTKGDATPTTSSSHAITVDKTGNGTVAVNLVTDPYTDNATSAKKNASVEVISTASDGYKLGSVKITNADGADMSTSVNLSADSNGYRHTFTMPDYDVKVVVDFQAEEVTSDPTLTLVVDSADAADQIKLSYLNYDDNSYGDLKPDSNGRVSVKSGSEVDIALAENSGYTIESVTADGTELKPANDGVYWFIINSDVTVTVKLSSNGETPASSTQELSVSVEPTAASNFATITMRKGSSTGSEVYSSSGYYDTVQKYTLTKGETYYLKVISTDDYQTHEETFTVASDAPDAATKVVTLKEKPKYKITMAETTGGTFSFENSSNYSKDVEVSPGTEIGIKAKPAEGYEIKKIIVMAGSEEWTTHPDSYSNWYDALFTMPESDVTITVKFKKQGTEEIDVPTAVTGLDYTGAELTGVADDSEGRYTVEGGKATDAGTYTATVTAETGYEFADGATATVEWTIGRAKIAAAPSVKTGLKYTGGAQVGVNYRTGLGYTVAGQLTGTNAGSYVATATPDKNHTWANGSTGALALAWSIAPKQIAVPVAAPGLKFQKGKTQTGVAAGEGYTVKGNTAVNAGSYSATVTPASNYAWTDGSTSAKTVAWSIAPSLKPTIKAKSTSKNVKISAAKKKAQTITLGASTSSKGKLTYKASGAKKGVSFKNGKITLKKGTYKKGTYSIKVKVTSAANGNYVAGSKTFTVKFNVKK